jgi:3-isopropylmalate/(R)-2-methylmalate dehydratase large subunit
MAININGDLPEGVTPKDVVLALIAKVGTGGGQGYIVEYRGTTIENMSMEGRMTICNMSIEWGAKAGMVAPDETTYAYLKGRPHAPEGAAWDAAVAYWRTLHTDDDAVFDAEVDIDATTLDAVRHVGHQPRPGHRTGRSRPVARGLRRPGCPVRRRTRLGVHGAHRRYPHEGHRRGHGVPGFVHQWADRGSATGRRGDSPDGRSPTASG